MTSICVESVEEHVYSCVFSQGVIMLLDVGIVGRLVDDSNEANDGQGISSIFLSWGDTEVAEGAQWSCRSVGLGRPEALFGAGRARRGSMLERWNIARRPYRAHPNECPTVLGCGTRE